MFYGFHRLPRALFVVLALMAFLITTAGHAAPTGMPSGVMVGSYPFGGTDTRLRLTGTATTSKDIALSEIWDGTMLAHPLTITSASLVYTSTALSFTAIAFPAAATTVSCSAQINVPGNYGVTGAGVLELTVYMNTADASAKLRVDVQTQIRNGLTTTAFVTGSDIAVPAAATGQLVTMSLTNAATYTAGGLASFFITKDAGTTAIVKIVAARFLFKPDYVMP